MFIFKPIELILISSPRFLCLVTSWIGKILDYFEGNKICLDEWIEIFTVVYLYTTLYRAMSIQYLCYREPDSVIRYIVDIHIPRWVSYSIYKNKKRYYVVKKRDSFVLQIVFMEIKINQYFMPNYVLCC